jgi:hypothetical protein
MKRRDFITLLAGGRRLWPIGARNSPAACGGSKNCTPRAIRTAGHVIGVLCRRSRSRLEGQPQHPVEYRWASGMPAACERGGTRSLIGRHLYLRHSDTTLHGKQPHDADRIRECRHL